MKIMKIFTALLLTAGLCGCNGENVEIKNSETVLTAETARTELTDSIAVMETQTLSNEPAAAPEDTGELLDTLDIQGYRVELFYDKTPGSLAEFYAVSCDSEGENPLCTVRFHSDEYTGTTNFTQMWGYMTRLGHSRYFTVSGLPVSSEGTVMLFEIDKSGMISLYSYENGHEIPAENPGINMTDYDGRKRMYDYGARRYAEYSIDTVNKAVTLEGELEYRSDIDMTYLVMRTDCAMKTFKRQMTQCIYGDSLTEAGMTDMVKYYRVSPDLAASADELRDMIDAAFTDEFAEGYFDEDPFTSYGDNIPAMFTEDSEGLVYSEFFRVSTPQCDYNTVRLITDTDTPGTAKTFVMNTDRSLTTITIMYFDETAEGCPAKNIETVIAGTYFLNE